MNQEFNISSTKNDITFPLTLSQAVWHLAAQRTGNFHNLDDKQKKQIHEKTWQQLSVRLRLIFKKFPKTIVKKTIVIEQTPDNQNSK
jgi:hypothetical protein